MKTKLNLERIIEEHSNEYYCAFCIKPRNPTDQCCDDSVFILITDPTFGYVNSALTNVQDTWKKHSTGVNNAGLFNNPNADRTNDKESGGQVPTQKIRRVQ